MYIPGLSQEMSWSLRSKDWECLKTKLYAPRKGLSDRIAQLLQPRQTSSQEAYAVPETGRLIVPGRGFRDRSILGSLLNPLSHQPSDESVSHQEAERAGDNSMAPRPSPSSSRSHQELGAGKGPDRRTPAPLLQR